MIVLLLHQELVLLSIGGGVCGLLFSLSICNSLSLSLCGTVGDANMGKMSLNRVTCALVIYIHSNIAITRDRKSVV